MGFIWCPFCKNPHLLSEQTCPITGQGLHSQRVKKSIEIGSLIQDKYLLKRKLGQGGYGIVYAAENVALGGEVALKFLGRQSKDAALRFEQEAKIANSLGHPNICRVFDSGSTKRGTPFFVMELLQGETLASRLKRGRLDPVEATTIISQVLSGLDAAHAKSIIHRDLKPENIFLEARGGLEPIPKILDFGLAKRPSSQPITKDPTGFAIGTILYMSPEQLLGEVLTPAADVFATAVVLYQALTSVHPFIGRSHSEVARRILQEIPAPLDGSYPRMLGAALGQALAKQPSNRFASALAFQSALHDAMGIAERWDPPASTIPQLSPDSSRDYEETTTVANPIRSGR